MEIRLRAAVGGAIAWTILIGVMAAQTKGPGIPAGTQLNPGRVSPGGGNLVIIGCVSREGQGTSQTFVLTDSRPEPPARFKVDGDEDLLRLHVGHTVEVGGPVTPVAAGAQGMPTLKMQSLTYVSITCLKLK